jgi:mono/diheme cytochrome c family protein
MRTKITIVLLVAFFTVSCGNKGQQQQQQQPSVIQQPDKTAVDPMASHPGKKVYEAACLACHMADGSGVPGMHPPLIESDFVNGDKEALIQIVLKGMSGKVEIKGEVYNGLMPPQAHLSDNEIAAVLTYVRGAFGNKSGEITPQEVQKVRNSN